MKKAVSTKVKTDNPNKVLKDEPTNDELLEIEEDTWDELGTQPNEHPYLYPNLDDPNFNIKIQNKKEFSDAK